jgi:hypothetical protein
MTCHHFRNANPIGNRDRWREAQAIPSSAIMKKPTLHVEQPQPRNIQRADIAPTEGDALVLDGHFKTQFAEEKAAREKRPPSCLRSIRRCKSRFTTHPQSHEPWLSNSDSASQQR